MARQPPKILTIVERRIKKLGVTPYAVANGAGIDRSLFYRWLRGDSRSIALEHVEKVLDELGLEIKPKLDE